MAMGDVAVAVVWIFFLAGAVSSGLKMGHATGPLGDHAPFPPINAAIFLLIFFFGASSAGVFLLRRTLLQRRGWAGRMVDGFWGQGTWATFVVRLKPIALMIIACWTLGIVGLASTYVGSQSWTSYFNSAFALSIGFGLAIAYALSRRYPPELP